MASVAPTGADRREPTGPGWSLTLAIVVGATTLGYLFGATGAPRDAAPAASTTSRGSIPASTTTTIGVTTSTTTSTSLPAPSREDEGRVIAGVAAGPDGFVAVGIDSGQPRERAAVWLSSDGVEWNRIADNVIFVDGEMRDVVWFPAGSVFVAVGRLVSQGAIWTSSDGSEWEQVAVLPFDGPGGGIKVEAVVSDERGLVAVGREWLAEGASIPAVWTSLDGSVWDRVEPGPDGIGDESAMIGFLSSGAAGFLVGGFVETSDQGYMPAVWSSGNAVDWTLTVIDDRFEGASVLIGLVNRLLRSSRPFAVPPSLAP